MTARTRLQKDLDKLMQEIYVKKYPICLVCGNKTTEMHHFIPKARSLYLRYDERNLIPLCKGCHLKHHKGDPEIHVVILHKKGLKWYKDLKKDRYKIMKRTMGNLRMIQERLEREKRCTKKTLRLMI